MPSFTISLVLSHQLQTVVQLLEACKMALDEIGIQQWVKDYPNERIVMQDIKNQDLFCIKKEDQILGVITLNEYQDIEYQALDWLHKKTKVMVVHRLAVHPAFQGNGLASLLMDFAEDKAQKEGYYSIRLDAYSGNPHIQRFYKKREYTYIGQVFFPMRPLAFNCFEKLI